MFMLALARIASLRPLERSTAVRAQVERTATLRLNGRELRIAGEHEACCFRWLNGCSLSYMQPLLKPRPALSAA